MKNYDNIVITNDDYQIHRLGTIWHRLDGPAVVHTPTKTPHYYIMDRFYLKKEYYEHTEVIRYTNEQKLRKALGTVVGQVYSLGSRVIVVNEAKIKVKLGMGVD